MNENEQIEEMARTLCRYYDDGICDCDKKLCDLECEEFTSAQHLYAKGYRKVERGEWISVDERLPDNHRRVLIACEGLTIGGASPIAIGSYGGGFWSITDANGVGYLTKYMHVIVTHWMPLPEPPSGADMRGEKNEDQSS